MWKDNEGSEGRLMSGKPGREIDGRAKSKSGRGIEMLNEIDGRLGSEMSGSPGSEIDGNAKSKSGKLGSGMLNEIDGRLGSEMSGKPGREMSGRQDMVRGRYSMTVFRLAFPDTPVTPVRALFTPGTATEPMQIDAPSTCA